MGAQRFLGVSGSPGHCCRSGGLLEAMPGGGLPEAMPLSGGSSLGTGLVRAGN